MLVEEQNCEQKTPISVPANIATIMRHSGLVLGIYMPQSSLLRLSKTIYPGSFAFTRIGMRASWATDAQMLYRTCCVLIRGKARPQFDDPDAGRYLVESIWPRSSGNRNMLHTTIHNSTMPHAVALHFGGKSNRQLRKMPYGRA